MFRFPRQPLHFSPSTFPLPRFPVHVSPSRFPLPCFPVHVSSSTFPFPPAPFHVSPATFALPRFPFHVSPSMFPLPRFPFHVEEGRLPTWAEVGCFNNGRVHVEETTNHRPRKCRNIGRENTKITVERKSVSGWRFPGSLGNSFCASPAEPAQRSSAQRSRDGKHGKNVEVQRPKYIEIGVRNHRRRLCKHLGLDAC